MLTCFKKTVDVKLEGMGCIYQPVLQWIRVELEVGRKDCLMY